MKDGLGSSNRALGLLIEHRRADRVHRLRRCNLRRDHFRDSTWTGRARYPTRLRLEISMANSLPICAQFETFLPTEYASPVDNRGGREYVGKLSFDEKRAILRETRSSKRLLARFLILINCILAVSIAFHGIMIPPPRTATILFANHSILLREKKKKKKILLVLRNN